MDLWYHRDWSVDKWRLFSSIMSSDSTYKTVYRRTLIWKEVDSHYLPSSAQEFDYYGNDDLNEVWWSEQAWGCMAHTQLHVFQRDTMSGGSIQWWSGLRCLPFQGCSCFQGCMIIHYYINLVFNTWLKVNTMCSYKIYIFA